MISFRREGKQVVVLIDSGLDVEKPTYRFINEREDENVTALVVNHLRLAYRGFLARERDAAYIEGLHEGRRRQKRKPKKKAKNSKG